MPNYSAPDFQSIINSNVVANHGVSLVPPASIYSSWIEVSPSAPPMDDEDFEIIPVPSGDQLPTQRRAESAILN